MKKCFAMLLALCCVLSLATVVTAAENENDVRVAQTVEITASMCPESSGQSVDTPDAELIIEKGAGMLGVAEAVYFGWFTQQLPPKVEHPTFDITEMDYVAFDLYVSRADALADVPVCFELTSGGICDLQEDSVFLSLNEVTTLVDGWNSVRIPLSLFPKGGADRTHINCFRIFNSGVVTVNEGEFWVIKLKNFGFGTDADGVTQTLPLDPAIGVFCGGTVYYKIASLIQTTLAAPEVTPDMFTVSYAATEPLDLSTYQYVDLAMRVTNAKELRKIKLEMELASSGMSEAQESSFIGFFDNVVEGWNTLRLPLSAFTRKVGGGADLSKINYIRLHSVGTEDRTLDGDVTIEFAKFIFSDAADVNFKEYTFEVGREAALPEEIIRISGRDAGENADCMFADGADEIVYRLSMDYITPSYIYVTMTTGGDDLLLQVSDRNKPEYYKTIVGEKSTDPRGTYVYDVSQYVNMASFKATGFTLYLRVADTDPTDGSGGQLQKETPVTISVGYSDWAIEGYLPIIVCPPYDTDGEENEHTIPLFDCNAEIGGFKQDWDDKMAGASSLSYTLGRWKEIDKVTGEDIEVTQNGQAGFQFKTEAWTGYDTIDATRMDTLEFWFYVSDKDALASVTFADNAMELTSSGVSDKDELSWEMTAILEQCTENGWNAIRLPFSTASGRAGEIDLSRVNFFRWYFINAQNLPEQPIIIKIDNLRLTDYVAQEREVARPTVQALLDTIEGAMADIPEWNKKDADVVALYQQKAEDWRARYSSLKDEYESLEPISQALAEELGAEKLLLQLSRWITNYDKYFEVIACPPLTPNVGETIPPPDDSNVTPTVPNETTDNGELLLVIGISMAIVLGCTATYIVLQKRKKTNE